MEGGGEGALQLARRCGEVADAEDGGVETLLGDGIENVLFGDGFGVQVGVGGVWVDAEGGDVDEPCLTCQTEVDDAVGAADVGLLDALVGGKVSCVGGTMDDGVDVGGQLMGCEGQEVGCDGDDACADMGIEGRAEVLVQGLAQTFGGVLLVIGTDEAVGCTCLVGEKLAEHIAA